MATRYYMRVVCETPSEGKLFHYHRWTVDGSEPLVHQLCPDHPTAIHRDMVIERTEAV